jgi:hypothetical protein
MRGLFLRGTGGNAAALGLLQQDAGRNATGTFMSVDDNIWGGDLVSGVFEAIVSPWGLDGGGGDQSLISFDLGRVWGVEHTAVEFRPLNRSVRYLIRALP